MFNEIKSKIQVAGAGAGKTYTMAQIIVDASKKVTDHKMIYAITYTNAAKENIIKKVIDIEGRVLQNVIVETVHTFFLNKIIYPNSKIILGEKYMKAVSVPLSAVPRYKQFKIKQLKDRMIIHNDVVFKKAKMILCKDNKRKMQKELIDLVIKHLKSSIAKIFVDEAQDLDGDALKIFQILANNDIYTYMVGDPKQALKYPGVFEEFVKIMSTSDEVAFDCLPNNNITKRIPNEHLRISNRFCSKDQKQYSIDNKCGIVKYCVISDIDSEKMYNLWKRDEYLIYISRKNGRYLTNNIKEFNTLPLKIVDQIENIKLFKGLDKDIVEKALVIKFNKYMFLYDSKIAISKFSKHYEIVIEKDSYAQLMEFQNKQVNNKDSIFIFSIDKVKGLEGDKCIFILNDSALDYIFGKKTERNKEYNKIYVGLTRSKRDLILLVDLSIIKRYSIEEIEDEFKKLEISCINIDEL